MDAISSTPVQTDQSRLEKRRQVLVQLAASSPSAVNSPSMKTSVRLALETAPVRLPAWPATPLVLPRRLSNAIDVHKAVSLLDRGSGALIVELASLKAAIAFGAAIPA